jgi:hypothetical protein
MLARDLITHTSYLNPRFSPHAPIGQHRQSDENVREYLDESVFNIYCWNVPCPQVIFAASSDISGPERACHVIRDEILLFGSFGHGIGLYLRVLLGTIVELPTSARDARRNGGKPIKHHAEDHQSDFDAIYQARIGY